MKTQWFRLLSLITGIIIFDFLFYNQSPGLNTLLFVPILSILIYISRKPAISSTRLLISLLGWGVAGFSVAYHSSPVSVLAFMGSFLVFVGFSFIPELKSLLSTVMQSGLNFFTAPFSMLSETLDVLRIRNRLPWFWKSIKLLVIPVLLLIIFTTIFRFANLRFNEYFLKLDEYFRLFLNWIEQFLTLEHIFFLGFTTVLIIGVLYKSKSVDWSKREIHKTDELIRNRRKSKYELPLSQRNMALKDEYRVGIILLVMLNLLLMVVNITEVLEMGKDYRTISAARMSGNLHDGTFLLIFSIILSIIVMMVLFRRNLNFYSHNQWLVRGAVAWIIQNLVLGLNVAWKNWFYISQYGLTYKRIGIIFFLLLVMTGLVLLMTKIRKRKSTWYLVKSNAWSFYVLFLILGLIDWDTFIIKYNLRPSAPRVDGWFLLQMPENNVKQLILNKERIQQADPNIASYIDEKLRNMSASYQETLASEEWQSYSLRDWQAKRFLENRE
ncbi:MAG: DUF4173 domain-containing protein [Bacteroidales bacterium]|nr:DUF4173 domain-containing protein [Bacteroidales bacterium]